MLHAFFMGQIWCTWERIRVRMPSVFSPDISLHTEIIMHKIEIHSFFDVSAKHYFLAACSGLLLTACFPPFGLAFVAWGALVPLLYLAARNKPPACFTLGWLAGLFHGLSLLYWITYVVNRYGGLPLLVSLGICFLLVGYLAIFPGLFCAGLSWLRNRGLPWLAAAPFLWVTLELGKSRLLTGFPWENLGYSQYSWLPVIQMADLTGVFGISLAFRSIYKRLLHSLKLIKKHSTFYQKNITIKI